MAQYLTEIKVKISAITTAGSSIDPKDNILYKFNELPPSYQTFKTTIRTTIQLVSLDDLYSLLCNEEIHLANEGIKDQSTTQLNHSTLVSFKDNAIKLSMVREEPPEDDLHISLEETAQHSHMLHAKFGHSIAQC